MRILSLSIFIILTSCVSSIQSDVPFNSKEVDFVKKIGTSTIKGELFAIQNGGGVVIGAGREVILIPVSSHIESIFVKVYGKKDGGYRSTFMHPTINFEEESKKYSLKKSTNSKGEFVFSKIPKGEYYVCSDLTWMAGTSLQGGSVVKRINVDDNKIIEVLLKF